MRFLLERLPNPLLEKVEQNPPLRKVEPKFCSTFLKVEKVENYYFIIYTFI